MNLNDNNLVEINPAKASVVGVKAIDPLVVDAAAPREGWDQRTAAKKP